MCDQGTIMGGAVGTLLMPGAGTVVGAKYGDDVFGHPVDPSTPFTQEQYLRNNQSAYDSFSNQYTDPARYAAMQNEYSANAQAATMNRYASMGLADSSAAMGAADNQDRLLRMQMMDRQLGDQDNIARTRMAYSQAIGGIDTSKLNLQMQQQAQNMQLIGSILGAGGTIAGGMMGGPAGAAAGSKTGAMVPGQNYTPLPDNYTNQNYTMPALGSGAGMGQQPAYGLGGGYAPGYFPPTNPSY